jgi:hypothetical protein
MCDESSPTSSVYVIELEVGERGREKKKMERERSLKNEARSVEPGGPRHVWSAGTAVRNEACIVTWQMETLHMPTIGLDWGYTGDSRVHYFCSVLL